MFDVRHALGTAGDDDVGSAGLHHHRGLDDSLEPGAATTVELKARDCLRQSGREPRPSADARRFSARIAMTEHHVVDALGVDPAAFHERLEDRGAEFAGGEGRKPASELADRGAERRDDRGATQLPGDKLLLFGCFFLEVRSRVRAGQRPSASRAGSFPSDIRGCGRGSRRSEEDTCELQSLMSSSYTVCCWKQRIRTKKYYVSYSIHDP